MMLFNKTMMCGGLVVLAPGSPIQVLFAILIMLLHLLFLNKLAPYILNSEDWSSFFATLGLCLMSLGAFAMMGESLVQLKSSETKAIGMVTTILPCLCITVVLGIIVWVDIGLQQAVCKLCSSNNNNNSASCSPTQVQPINDDTIEGRGGDQLGQQEEKENIALRTWGHTKTTI
jgi:hypothetical protein